MRSPYLDDAFPDRRPGDRGGDPRVDRGNDPGVDRGFDSRAGDRGIDPRVDRRLGPPVPPKADPRFDPRLNPKIDPDVNPRLDPEDTRWGALAAAWDASPSGEGEHYQGRRRFMIAAGRWRWLALAIVGTALVAGALGAALSVATGNASGQRALWSGGLPSTDGTDAGSPDPSALPSPGPTESVQPSNSPHPNPTTSPALPPFPAVTYEAERGTPVVTLTGSAQITTASCASGGKVVSGLGNTGQGDPGVMRIAGLVIPSTGQYRITVHYVNPTQGPHKAVIAVSGAQAVTLNGKGAGQCRDEGINLVLTAGTHTITISNPADPAPWIDKIVVSRP